MLTIREKALKEMIRVTRPEGLITIVDYALPENRIGKFLVYQGSKKVGLFGRVRIKTSYELPFSTSIPVKRIIYLIVPITVK